METETQRRETPQHTETAQRGATPPSDPIWRMIEPQVWKPQRQGDFLAGVLVSILPRDTELSARYYIDTGHETFMVWGSAVLDDRMQYVSVGNRIRITYKGMTKNKKNRDMILYQVEVAQNQEEASTQQAVNAQQAMNTQESVPEERVR